MTRRAWLWVGWRDSFLEVRKFFPESGQVCVDTAQTSEFLDRSLNLKQRYSGLMLCSSFQHLSEVERETQMERLKRAVNLFLASNDADVVFLSSAAVYGLRHTNTLLKETDSINGSSAYAQEKISIELFLLREAASQARNVLILRAPGLFGKSSNFTRRNGLVDRLRYNSEKLEIEFFGRQVRDFLHVNDLFRVIRGMMVSLDMKAESPRHKIYNVTNGEARSVRDVCNQFSDRNLLPEIVYRHSYGPLHCALDGGRLKSEYGYSFLRVSDLL